MAASKERHITALYRRSHEAAPQGAFDYSLDYKQIDFRKQPELYRTGKGEQGVLIIEPYKSEILPHWKFRTAEIAEASSKKIYAMFLGYLKQGDFVGADMARKFLQMGYTRARRYANHTGGKKYASNPQLESTAAKEKAARKNIMPFVVDAVKAEAAEVFRKKWQRAKVHPKYAKLLAQHKAEVAGRA
ncbi:MAG: DUF4385 domain-containing protein [Rhizobacter sp.]|nr:DUF4385 domain-containing protein [Chlorobiales bacterium]